MDPPNTELLQELDCSELDVAGLRLDHAGYYVGDVEASAQTLIARGMPQRVQVFDKGGQAVQASMHQLHDGMWIELVNASFQGQHDWIRATLDGTAPPPVWPD